MTNANPQAITADQSQLLALWNMIRAYSELSYKDKLTDDEHVQHLEAIKKAAEGLPTLTPAIVASLIGFSNEELIWKNSDMHVAEEALKAVNATCKTPSHLVWFKWEVRDLQEEAARKYLLETAPNTGPWVPLEAGHKVVLSSGSNDWYFYSWRPALEADLGLPEGSTYTHKAEEFYYWQVLKSKFLEGATICTGFSEYPVYHIPVLGGYLKKTSTSSPYRFTPTL